MSSSTGNTCPPRENNAPPAGRARRRRKAAYSVAGLALAGAVFFLVLHRAEPRSNGRSLTEWLEVMAKSRDGPDGKAAETAIREMNREAIPVLVDMVGAREPVWWRPLCKWSKWTPLHLDPERFYRQRARALGGFWALGRAGKAAGPRLASLLEEPDSADEVIFALAAIGEAKPLLAAMPKSDAIRRAMIVDVLGTMPQASDEVLRVFRETLRSRDPVMRLAACEAAKALGPRAVAAMRRELEIARDDGDEHVRSAAQAALATIKPNGVAKPKD